MKNLFLKLSFLLILLLQFSNNAQTIQLKIRLFDPDSNYISNANISLSDIYFATTNNIGEAIFSNLKRTSYLLKISHISFNKFESKINIWSDTLLVINLNPGKVNLGEVIVTSGKYEQNINLLPYSVSKIDLDEIQINPAFTISDLLKFKSGISLLRDGIWGTEVSIRGLSRANIVTLIDGNRIETSTDISARLSLFDMNDIERIEVIKGAASSLYGSGATGGIINVISKSGSYSEKVKLKINYSGGFNSVNNLFSNGINLIAGGNEWIAKLGGSFRKAGNTKTPSGDLKNSQFKDESFNALFRFRTTENQELKFDYQQFNAFDVGIPGAAPLFPNNAIVTYPKELRRLLSVEYKINNLTNSLIKLTGKYFYQFISRDVENIPGTIQFVAGTNGQPPRRVSVLKISPGADHTVNGFQTQADFKFNNHYLITGVDYWKRNYVGIRTRDQKIEILNPNDSSVVKTVFKTIYEKPLPDANFNSAGIYIQDETKIFDDLAFTIGGRYDFIWLDNSQTLNPLYEINDGVINNNPAGQKIIWNSESVQNKSYVFNLGFVYSLNTISNFSLNISRSFRSPSLEERYQYIDLGNLVRVGDPNLKPEQGYFFDFGYKVFTDNLNFTSSIYLNNLIDLVAEIPGTFEDRSALIKTNVGKAILYGFEYNFNFNINEQLNVYNNLSYVRGLDKQNDKNLPQIPPLNGALGIEYNLFNWFTADFSINAFNKQNEIADGEISTPGYAVFNFRIILKNLVLGNIKAIFSAGIENILNKEYRNHLSTNRGFIVSEPGRNFYIKTNIEF